MSDVIFTFFDHPSAHTLYEAWRRSIAELLPQATRDLITVVAKPFEDMRGTEADFDCLVSPANSYAIMDGGIDMVFSRAFSGGKDHLALSRIVQNDISARWFGFAPPSSCTLVRIPAHLRNIQYPQCSMLAVCPTMRVPTNVSWNEDLVYNTMWTLLCELEHWNMKANPEDMIKKVAIPGFATGIGMYDHGKCARQMVLAVKHFCEARSEEGQKRLEDRAWTTNWDNVLENAMDVVDD